MVHDTTQCETLPLRGKISVLFGLMHEKPRGNHSHTDWDLSNQAHNWWRNRKAKNSKAKHRKKFSR